MHELEINGITVKYPFIPYEVQKHYMQSVIRSLENSENAALESPTGWLLKNKRVFDRCVKLRSQYCMILLHVKNDTFHTNYNLLSTYLLHMI